MSDRHYDSIGAPRSDPPPGDHLARTQRRAGFGKNLPRFDVGTRPGGRRIDNIGSKRWS